MRELREEPPGAMEDIQNVLSGITWGEFTLLLFAIFMLVYTCGGLYPPPPLPPRSIAARQNDIIT